MRLQFFSFFLLISASLLVVAQAYLAETHNEHVIAGNAAVVKCEIPSFVADFVSVTAWTEETSGEDFYFSERFGADFFDGFSICFLCIYDRFLYGFWNQCSYD